MKKVYGAVLATTIFLNVMLFQGCNKDENPVTPPENQDITVTNPASTMSYGQQYTISWTSQGISSSESVELRVDWAGVSRTIVSSTSNDGSYNWIVPSDLPLNTDLVLVVTWYSTSGDVWDVSTPFRISSTTSKSITVTNPASTMSYGQQYTISWTSQGISSSESVELRVDWAGVSRTIVSSTSNDGSYNWIVPSDLPLNTDLVLVVTWYSTSGDVWDVSTPFRIN